MADRERIIRALENCVDLPTCRDCPWTPCGYEDERHINMPVSLAAAALEALREKEAVRPVPCYDDAWECGNCRYSVVGFSEKDELGGMRVVRREYCPSCGRKVKWDA